MGSSDKTPIKLAVLGHVDSGKSTVAGQMMYQWNAVDEATMEELENDAANSGWESSEYAWIFDKRQDERASGDTIDVTLGEFETDDHVVTLIDCPGHNEYTKNMINGTVGADCALLVVSAAEGEFEEGLRGQMREHARLAFYLGIRRVIVAITKMDSCDWSEDRYNEIVTETKRILSKQGFNAEKTPYVPISGLTGDNISTAIDSPWYNGWPSTSNGVTSYPGKSLLDAIKYFPPPARRLNASFRLPIRKVYNIPNVGTIVTGTVIAGRCRPGMTVRLSPGGSVAQVQSIQQFHKQVKECNAGDIVGLNLGDLSDDIDVRRCAVVSEVKDSAAICDSFTAHILVLDRALKSGCAPSVHCGTGHAPCKFEITDVLDSRTGKSLNQKEKIARPGLAALVKVTPLKHLCAERYQDYQALGRIIVRDSGRTIAVGTVEAVDKTTDIAKARDRHFRRNGRP
ncbi:P-loop containing nucleoside triphosphate hydrolase protein [Aspergillus minisclerotigenes]|uniref:Elongation factor 1-alpha n=1 Tax=Aspergillus minisclerotigenes TaxID=656917 RepID=A0A5N6JFS2_9EURO|nr:P-loop containing nucleoside triphosphate hydrolase protein [Aspergillus minisclerotigenes]